MSELKMVPSAAESPWDTGELGRDETHVECAPVELKAEIEDALELQMISIRLQKDLITELKLIADYRGIGYQPLMRDVLRRFTRHEIMQIAKELQESEKARLEIVAAQAKTA